MKQIRIGKDISLRWEITTDGEAMPLEGRDLTVELKSPIGKVSNMPFRVDGNVLIMTYYGYEQTHYGEYSLTLWENRGKPGQNVVDAIRAFKLVRTSQEEEDFIGGDLQVECVDLGTSNLDILLGSTTSGDSPDLSALKRKVDANTTRISAVEDKNTEQDERIAALLQDTPLKGRHINAFTETGEYHIHGERTDTNDGLPILNEGTIDARLTVLDSSLTNGAGEKTDIVVTQILRLSNRMGGDGHVYVRTAQAANKSQLATPSSTAWGTWEKLMGIFEKNAVTNIADLDTYTTNGMYSGLFAKTTLQTLGGLQFTPGDTFLLITVNGYAASAFGTPQLTQMLYRLPAKKGSGNNSARMYMRTAYWNKDADPKAWVWANWDRLATASEISGGGGGSIEEYNRLIELISANTEKISSVERTANAAKSAAETAQAAAETAQETANSALGTATAASTAAQEAKTAADNANNLATEAQNTAASAKQTADGIAATANEAKETAQAAKETAQAAKAEIIENVGSLNEEDNRLSRLIAASNAKIASVESTATQARDVASSANEAAAAEQTKNAAQDARLDNIEARIDPDIAGRVWNEDNGTYRAESYYGSVKALRDLPKRLGLGRYLVSDERQKTKLHPNDSTKYLDGTPAALDGTEGQCMWCWEGFYANIWHEGSRLIKAVTFDGPVGNEISIWIPAGGISWLGAGVMDRTEQKLCSLISDDERYRGGEGKAVYINPDVHTKAPSDTTPQITMRGMPATNISTTDFGNYARKRGEGWEANWFVSRFVVEFLFEVIMGTENSQEAFNNLKDANGLYQGGFGNGIAFFKEWNRYNNNYPLIPTRVGLEAGDGVCLVDYNIPNASGGTYHTFNVPVFFGLVGAGFGNLWQCVRGIIVDPSKEKHQAYVSPSMYAAYDNKTVSDKILVAECPREQGWITRKSYRGLCCMPTEVGGSASIRYSDSYYTNSGISTDLRVRFAGGFSGNSTEAGASYTNMFNKHEYKISNASAPLCYFTEDPIIPESQSIATNY